MHIIVTREDVSKYGLQGLIDANENEPISLESLLALLGHGPVIRPGMAAPIDHPVAALWVDTMRLRARIEATMLKMPRAVRDAPLQGFQESLDDFNNVVCYLTTALGYVLDLQAREAAGLAPDSEDTASALQGLITDTVALEARALPILTRAMADDGEAGRNVGKVPVMLDFLVGSWGPQVRQDLAADQAADPSRWLPMDEDSRPAAEAAATAV